MTDAQHVTVLEHRVRYAETDRQGVVFYGAFFTWQDEALNAAHRRIGYDTDCLDEEGGDVSTVHAEMDYLGPARYGDSVAVDIRVADIGESSVTWSVRVRRTEAGPDARRAGDVGERRHATGEVVHATVDGSGEAIPLPAGFRSALEAFGE